MYPSARILRGLSIAIIVLAIIALITSFVVILAGTVMTVASSAPEITSSVDIDAETAAELEEHDVSTDDAFAMVGVAGMLGSASGVLGVIGSIICLIAGIIGIRSAKRPENAGSAKVWMIVGAVAGFFASIPVMILCIIAAVFAHKYKGEVAQASAYGEFQQ